MICLTTSTRNNIIIISCLLLLQKVDMQLVYRISIDVYLLLAVRLTALYTSSEIENRQFAHCILTVDPLTVNRGTLLVRCNSVIDNASLSSFV